MTEVQAQPDAGPKVESTDRDALIAQLDGMLEHYLNTLDKYQKAQQQLSLFLSAGYLSLAEANFNNHARTRFGQDYYDERMQASRKSIIGVDGLHVTFSSSAPDSPAPVESELEAAESADSPEISSDSLPAASKEPTASELREDVKRTSSNNGKTSRDPLRWFGILVPSALRSAQASFVSAVDGPVPQLATITKELRRQEVEIGRMRKQIRKL